MVVVFSIFLYSRQAQLQGCSDAKNPRGENEFLENPRGAKPKQSSFSGFFGQKYQNSRGAKGARVNPGLRLKLNEVG